PEPGRRQIPRRAALAVTVALAATVTALPARPQVASTALSPSVSISGHDGAYLTARTCEGFSRPAGAPAVTLRLDRPAAAAIAVRVQIAGGSLVAGRDYEPLPATVSIGAGDLGGTVRVMLRRVVTGTLAVRVQPGRGYALGATSTDAVSVAPKALELTCRVFAPVVLRARVGDAFPARPLDRAHVPGELFNTVIVRTGHLPPGISGVPAGPYAGRSTIPGTYRFHIDFTLADLVLARVPFEVRVRGAGASAVEGGRPQAPAAVPASGPARFTG
ncbi:MAG: hypothetical protein JWN46_1257, partial [Acidimicrobiales bacterium]|nr:hypothetical protein [Acidimicrobiales bacterium]